MKRTRVYPKRFGGIVSAAIIACALTTPAAALAQGQLPTSDADAIEAQAIRLVDMDDVSIELDQTNYAYTGAQITPDPFVYIDAWTWYQYYGVYGEDGPEYFDTAEDFYHNYDVINDPNFTHVEGHGWVHPLVEGTDYYLTYLDNVNPGTAYVNVIGTDTLVTGSTGISFTISGAPQPTPSTKGIRLAGATRYETMEAIVDTTFKAPGDGVAILASGNTFPDALSAAGLAGIHRAPILITQPNSLSAQVLGELGRLNISKVYIMGGMNAISENVERALEDRGYETYRVNGSDRVETSIKALDVAALDGARSNTVVIACGSNFADALSISPFAYQTASPIVLTQANGVLSDGTLAVLKANAYITNAIIVGGPNAVKTDVENQLRSIGIAPARLQGSTRYETSLAIANWECSTNGFDWVEPIVATGTAFPDALTGAQFAGFTGRPILLVNKTSDVTVGALGQHKGEVGGRYYVLGGPSAVSDQLVRYIDSII